MIALVLIPLHETTENPIDPCSLQQILVLAWRSPLFYLHFLNLILIPQRIRCHILRCLFEHFISRRPLLTFQLYILKLHQYLSSTQPFSAIWIQVLLVIFSNSFVGPTVPWYFIPIFSAHLSPAESLTRYCIAKFNIRSCPCPCFFLAWHAKHKLHHLPSRMQFIHTHALNIDWCYILILEDFKIQIVIILLYYSSSLSHFKSLSLRLCFVVSI